MPNYLMIASGRPNAESATGKKEDMVYVDNMYKTRVFNQDYSIDFTGKLPEDFQISLAGNWGEGLESAFMDMLGGALGGARQSVETMTQAAGLSTRARFASARTWETPSYLSLSIPISLYAYANTQEEVIDELVNLLCLTAPEVTNAGLFKSPGPSPIKTMMNDAGGLASEFAKNLEGQILTVQIGTFFTATPVIVQNVSASFDGLMEHGTGNPISVSCILEVESFFAVSKQDVKAWFHGGNNGPA